MVIKENAQTGIPVNVATTEHARSTKLNLKDHGEMDFLTSFNISSQAGGGPR